MIKDLLRGEVLGDGYLHRWVLRIGKTSIRLHHWTGSDDLRAPHDHPWDFFSLLLCGEMYDITPGPSGGYLHTENGVSWNVRARKKWRWEYFPAKHRHSVLVTKPCWTIMVCSPEEHNWGFYTPRLGGKQAGKVRFWKRNKYFSKFGHH